MTLQKGSDVTLHISNGGIPEVFYEIGGLTNVSLVLNNAAVAANTLATGAFRTLQPQSGARSLTISGTGLFTDSSAEDALRGHAFNDTIQRYRLLFGIGCKIEGMFLVTSFSKSGNISGEETYGLTLESAGEFTYA